MGILKLRPELLCLPANVTDRWYVTNGAEAIGPVNLELLSRGIDAGLVPAESYVRHEAWKVWRPLAELAEPDLEETDVEGLDDDAPITLRMPPMHPSASYVATSSQRA